VFDWLKSLLELVTEAGNIALLDQCSLLPSQTGVLSRRSDLRYDNEIPPDLKTIADPFDVKLRDGLLDSRAETPRIIELLPEKTEEEAVDEILDSLASSRQEEWLALELVPANVALFWWLAKSPKHRHRLDGYPVVTAEESQGRARLFDLKRDRERAPLAPPEHWPTSAIPFGSLFPRRKLLHSSVAEADSGATSDAWSSVAHDGFIRPAPLFRSTRRLDKLLVPMLIDRDEDEAHESEDEVAASDIAFLIEDDIGLIDAARKSRSRAVQLIEFLTSSVVEEDSGAFDAVAVSCECGEKHDAFPAAWLKPLRDRSWIPLAGGMRSIRVSAESLASLVADRPELVERLGRDRGSQLLQALGISAADFQLRAVATDEHQRLALVRSIGDLARAAGGDIDRVEMLVNEIRERPEIIDEIEKGKEQRRKVLHNQQLGALVEDLLQEELTAQGLTVRRTGIGSDFEIDSDVTDGEEEVWLEIKGNETSILVEVKSARADRVRMTPTQAKKAREEQPRFALCVVPLADDSPTREVVRDECRFVFDIGHLLDEPLRDYISLLNATDEARQQAGQIDVEISEGQIRFAVGRPVWAGGLALQGAIAEITSRTRRSP
jgi:hypothetical protein